MTKRWTKGLATGAATIALAAAGALPAAADSSIVTVVKITGETWFVRMEEGVQEFGATTDGVTARQVGPAQADAAQQAGIIQDLIAQGVDAIAVVPMDPSALEGVLRRAMERGITVITHEAETMENTQVNMEAFRNEEFGAHMNEKLVACMGGEGKWTTFVGSVGSLTHVQWAEAGAANAEQYPGMELVSPLNESFNDANRAYQVAREILRAHPDIKGFQGGSAIDVIGIGRAVEEAGLVGEVCVTGIGLPQDTAPFLESGAVLGISFWDPKDAGMVMNKLAHMALMGEEITDGMDLGVPGYESVSVEDGPGGGIIVRGQAWVDVDASNWQDYPF